MGIPAGLNRQKNCLLASSLRHAQGASSFINYITYQHFLFVSLSLSNSEFLEAPCIISAMLRVFSGNSLPFTRLSFQHHDTYEIYLLLLAARKI